MKCYKDKETEYSRRQLLEDLKILKIEILVQKFKLLTVIMILMSLLILLIN